MSKYLDLAGTEIEAGDWVVQAYNKGRCAAIKFAYVVDAVDKLTYVGYHNSYYDVRVAKYSVYYPERSLVIDRSMVPDHIAKAILRKAGGM